MSDVTQLLEAAAAGDSQAAADLLPHVYEELRKLAAARMAAEKPGQTLQATALVHEAYLRLMGARSASKGCDPSLASAAGFPEFANRAHFFAAAAEAMRRILIENARRKGRLKRGGDLQRIDLDAVPTVASKPDDDLLALNEALDQLGHANADAAAVVKLRYFAGLTGREAAEALGVRCVKPISCGLTLAPGCSIASSRMDDECISVRNLSANGEGETTRSPRPSSPNNIGEDNNLLAKRRDRV